jgi:hypothetical protein
MGEQTLEMGYVTFTEVHALDGAWWAAEISVKQV